MDDFDYTNSGVCADNLSDFFSNFSEPFVSVKLVQKTIDKSNICLIVYRRSNSAYTNISFSKVVLAST